MTTGPLTAQLEGGLSVGPAAGMARLGWAWNLSDGLSLGDGIVALGLELARTDTEWRHRLTVRLETDQDRWHPFCVLGYGLEDRLTLGAGLRYRMATDYYLRLDLRLEEKPNRAALYFGLDVP